jgi:CheY-like chemotaxis protein
MTHFAQLNRATILLVEDEVIIRLQLIDLLRDMGLEVLAADSADEAIALFEAHPEIELLMTDITMPGSMDGIALAHYVHRRRPTTRIIVGSGMIDTGLSKLPAGSVFLPKPFDDVELRQVLLRLMRGAQPSPLGDRAA